jgi:hypothetical protein
MQHEIDHIFGNELIPSELVLLQLARDKGPEHAHIQIHRALHQASFLGQKTSVFLLHQTKVVEGCRGRGSDDLRLSQMLEERHQCCFTAALGSSLPPCLQIGSDVTFFQGF